MGCRSPRSTGSRRTSFRPKRGVEFGGNAVPVAELVFERGWLDLDVVEPNGGVDDDGAFGRGLADYLLAGLALRRNGNHQVAEDFARAGEPATRQRAVLAEIVRFPGVRGRDVIGTRGNAVLREVALLHADLALAARLAAAANGFDLDAQRTGGIKQIRPGPDLTLAAGRLKNDAIRLVWHGIPILAYRWRDSVAAINARILRHVTGKAKRLVVCGLQRGRTGWSPPTRERATVRAFLISLDMASAKRDKEWRLAARPIIPTSPPWEASHAVAGPFEPSCCASRLQNASLLPGLAARHRDHGRLYRPRHGSLQHRRIRDQERRAERVHHDHAGLLLSLGDAALFLHCGRGQLFRAAPPVGAASSRTSGRSGCSSRSSPAPSCSVRSRSISRGGTGWPRA